MSPAVKVQLQDLDGQAVDSTNNVTLSLVNNTAGATLSGNLTVTAVNGVATFSNLSVDRRGNFALQATSPGLLASNSSSFNVTAAAGLPFQLAFVNQPTGINASVPLSAISIAIQDINGVTVANNNSTVTLNLGANPGLGVLSGVRTVTAVNGVAQFNGLSIDNPADGYTLVASTNSVQVGNLTSSAFNITGGLPSIFSNSRGGKLFKIDPNSLAFTSTNIPPNGGSCTALGIDPVSRNLFTAGAFTGNSYVMGVIRASNLGLVTSVLSDTSVANGISPKRIAPDPTRGRMYVPSGGGLRVFDTSLAREVTGSPVAVGPCLSGVAFDTRRDLIYVFTQDAQQNKQLNIINAATLQPVAGSPLALPGPAANFDSPSKVVYDSVNDNLLWTTGSGSGQTNLHVLNAATLQLRPFSPVTTGSTCRGLALDAVHNRVLVSNFGDNTISVYNATTLTSVMTTATNNLFSPEDIYYEPNSNRAFVSNFNGDGGVTVFDGNNMTAINVVAPSNVTGGDLFDQVVGGP